MHALRLQPTACGLLARQHLVPNPRIDKGIIIVRFRSRVRIRLERVTPIGLVRRRNDNE